MPTPPQRRRVNKEEKPKKNTTRMALIDHFRKDDGHESHSMKRRARSLFQTTLKRVGLMMISSVFGQKKTEESSCFSEDEKGEVRCMESNESAADCKQECTSDRETQQTSSALTVVPAKVQFSFKSMFSKTRKSVLGFGFLRSKGSGDRESENGFGKAGVIGGREESSDKLQRVSSRIAIQTFTTGGSMRGKSTTKKNGREERLDDELCKKRILMGGKCKPLNDAGTLHYDKDGFLLPDVLP